MGRRHLLTAGAARLGAAALVAAALGGVAACVSPPAGAFARVDAEEGHRTLVCADCHAGPLSDRGLAQADEATCTASGCHTDGGPAEVILGSVAFAHRGHGGDSVAVMECSGCHTHPTPEAALVAEVDACSFCHLSEQAAGSTGECRLCHQNLEHAGLTSQGVSVPHDGLPWIDGGCVRCHYDVTEPPVAVSPLRCGACHDDVEAAVDDGAGLDLHVSHASSSCIACHDEGQHRIRALSSSVSLQCADCHREEHEVAVTTGFPDAATCNRCHVGAHEPQQRMVLGLVDDLDAPDPSQKFLDGLTCRSCHQAAPASDPAVPVRGRVQTCVECHRSEYATVERWWREGTAQRVALAAAYARTATSRVGADAGADARAALDEADRLIQLVDTAGAVHNLTLAHRLLETATERVAQAYVAAGRTAPSVPDLGREPNMGLCSYCHYRTNDPWVFQEMSGPFHRDVLRLSGGG